MYKAINYSTNARLVVTLTGIDRNLLLANEGIHTLVNRAAETAQKAKALLNTVEVAIYALVNCSLKRDDGSRKLNGHLGPEAPHCIFSCSAAVGACCCCELGASLEAGAAYYGLSSGTGSVSLGATSSFCSPSASSSISASMSSCSSSPPSSTSEPSSR